MTLYDIGLLLQIVIFRWWKDWANCSTPLLEVIEVIALMFFISAKMTGVILAVCVLLLLLASVMARWIGNISSAYQVQQPTLSLFLSPSLSLTHSLTLTQSHSLAHSLTHSLVTRTCWGKARQCRQRPSVP